MSSVMNREQLAGPVLQEFERLYAWLHAFLGKEHTNDGAHTTGTWTPYTPTWSSIDGTAALGNGILQGRYTRIGSTVFYTVLFTAGSTTNFGADSWLFGLPVPPSRTEYAHVGSVYALGGTPFNGVAFLTSNGFLALADSNGIWGGPSVPFAWSTGDGFRASGWYEP